MASRRSEAERKGRARRCQARRWAHRSLRLPPAVPRSESGDLPAGVGRHAGRCRSRTSAQLMHGALTRRQLTSVEVGMLGRLVVLAAALALGACTGGDMGNTRGGGAAPGQSGGRDTSAASAAGAAGAAAATASGTGTRAPVDGATVGAATASATDTSNQQAKSTKKP